MRKLGVSIYPEKSNPEEVREYLQKAAKAGFKRVFTNLLSVDVGVTKEEIVKEFKETNEFAKSLGFEIIIDVSPRIFAFLEIDYKDLSFFHEVGADGLRLDAGFTGSEEAMMTYNPFGLLIEVNMSNDVHTIDTIMDYKPNRFQLIGCHNFYPHNYSGLPLEFFTACSLNFRKYGLRTAAFVTSQAPNTFGPWPVTDGLPTLEMHRNLPIDIQMKHLLSLDLVDDIIISNCYPSDEELDRISKLDLTKLSLAIDCIDDLPETEAKIIFEENHFNRGDINEYFLRSTQSRVKYKGHFFERFHVPEMIRRGDVIIETSYYGHYAGELQIALQDMKNSGHTNVVGRLREEELFLLDTIKPWQKFSFMKNEAK